VEDYLNVLLYGEDHPAPWTDISHRVNATQPRQQKPVIGFKIMYNTLAKYRSVYRWISERGPRVIHLTRNNLLRKYTSMIRMSNTRIAHTKDRNTTTKKVYINAENFLEFAKTQTDLVRYYRGQLGGQMPYLELSYEEFFADTASSKKAILDFLEVENVEMPFHNMKKIGSTRLSDDIENWGELAARLGDTPYAIFLEEPEPFIKGKNV
jgi:LPS sulfotransferase NodH